MSQDRRALITGVAGQDGSFLAELLAAKGYAVTGTVAEAAGAHAEIVQLRLDDQNAVAAAVAELRPTEVYHLASISFVPAWWEDPVEHSRSATAAVAALLEAVRSKAPDAAFVYASSAEIFGEPAESPQNEETPVRPLTPYGAAKAFGHFLTQSFRRRYGIRASSAILFNHESPRRPEHFVTRKITRAAAAISLGLQDELLLGELDARRDWGYAGDYVGALWLMAQQENGDDYVIGTGEAHTVEDFVEAAFSEVGLDWRRHVRRDDALVRGDSGISTLVADAAKARERLGWTPATSFGELVTMMVRADLEALQRGGVGRVAR